MQGARLGASLQRRTRGRIARPSTHRAVTYDTESGRLNPTPCPRADHAPPRREKVQYTSSCRRATSLRRLIIGFFRGLWRGVLRPAFGIKDMSLPRTSQIVVLQLATAHATRFGRTALQTLCIPRSGLHGLPAIRDILGRAWVTGPWSRFIATLAPTDRGPLAAC